MNDIDLQAWVGKREESRDRIYPTPIKALALTLNYRDFEVREGRPLPELWHWFYFLPLVARAEIGVDGHPKLGGFLPPISLQRRMWASGKLIFHQDLLMGEEVTKISEILKISEKQGKAGSMIFVTLKHTVLSGREVAVEEWQDIVYLPMPESFVQPVPNPVPKPVDWSQEYPIDPVLLFRFSALTFNSHRIHYDLNYATEVEKYPGLVVHGPLQALLLLESAKKNNPDAKPAEYGFRAVRPLFAFDKVSICGRRSPTGDHDLFSANTDGNVGMQATVSWR